ncbi:hypothetical protein [Streptomyces sp. HUAS TT7]|uniref:hypothetical protein n=1 Tax=Streptomyces sp. HUAS TT7 TaxID=3447507 RepID=UPI003F65FAB1
MWPRKLSPHAMQILGLRWQPVHRTWLPRNTVPQSGHSRSVARQAEQRAVCPVKAFSQLTQLRAVCWQVPHLTVMPRNIRWQPGH